MSKYFQLMRKSEVTSKFRVVNTAEAHIYLFLLCGTINKQKYCKLLVHTILHKKIT